MGVSTAHIIFIPNNAIYEVPPLPGCGVRAVFRTRKVPITEGSAKEVQIIVPPWFSYTGWPKNNGTAYFQ